MFYNPLTLTLLDFQLDICSDTSDHWYHKLGHKSQDKWFHRGKDNVLGKPMAENKSLIKALSVFVKAAHSNTTKVDKTRKIEVARFAINLYDSGNLDYRALSSYFKAPSSVQNCHEVNKS